MMECQKDLPADGPDQVVPATSHKCWEPDAAVELQMTKSGPASEPSVSVHTFFRRVAEQYPSQHALAVKRNGQWLFWNYEDYFKECRIVAKAFIKLGLERFYGVCIMGFNSPEWLIANFGCIFAGGISAGNYTTNSPEASRHLAADCRAQIIVLENQEYVDKFLLIKDSLPHIKVMIQWSGTPTSPGVLSWQQLMDLGKQEPDDSLEARLKMQATNQCCTLIYTSGTTGPPKGVMCSQDNLTWCGQQYSKTMNLVPCCESVVSYLPLSHLAAQMTEIYVSLPVASTIYFAQPDALKGSLGKTLLEAQPTGFLGVPRVWEKIHEKMQEAGREASATTLAVAGWAKKLSLNYYRELQQGRSLGLLDSTQLSLARWLVLGRVKGALGLSNAHNLVSGSAPLSVEVHDFFMSLDLPIMEGYGLSESLSIGTICTLTPKGFKHGSVGKVLPLTSLRLEESSMASGRWKGEGEICIKGRNVFMGYLNLEAKTHEAIRDDGWMLSGDLGWLDSEGFLYITGRVKELVITAGGENIPPVIIEEAIKKRLPVLANAMLVGDRRKYLAILLTVKCEADPNTGAPLDTLVPSVVEWCSEHDFKATTVTEFKEEMDNNRQGKVAKAVQAAIDWYNKECSISNAQKVQRWSFLPHDFSAETGELNNTLKLKRSVAAELHAQAIEDMYSDSYPGCGQKH